MVHYVSLTQVTHYAGHFLHNNVKDDLKYPAEQSNTHEESCKYVCTP